MKDMKDLKILLVDDDESFLAIITKTIESWGYEVISFTDGQKAIEVIKKKGADIIILDYLMPKMEGISLLKEIRKIGSKIPAIMFSSIVGETIEGAGELDVCSFIPKYSAVTSVGESLKTAIRIAEKRLDKSG
jgi:two-component system alkaline phosphatase synthesis response regulator PhoP